MDLIVREIGRDWRGLARKLCLSEADIDYIVDKHRPDLREQCREALKMWVEVQVAEQIPASEHRNKLIKALQDSEKRLLAAKVSKIEF